MIRVTERICEMVGDLKNFILSFRASISCERKIRARHDYKIAETKLTQIHTYRNGVFEGTNYRATHFRPMSRRSPFFDRLPTWKYDNACLPGVKEKNMAFAWMSIRPRAPFREKKKIEREKNMRSFPDSLCISHPHTAVFDVSTRQFRRIFKSYLRTHLPQLRAQLSFHLDQVFGRRCASDVARES